ncbi:hypothetical protein ANCCEY_09495 [Ancylostoma ceylanicum]|uniref:Uncharacterized protein n=1 Tax=Ancylostoma ceylanicum TaxID=53326 RepID=A0A0D6LUU0_9BILA|nr:hypothetical protein ANCCEY_09495 [Ancylostoma ceylanicum]
MAKWAHIKLDPVVWEELPRNGDGARVLSCRNYDPETKHRYRWRFNGSSILPKQIEVRRGRLVPVKEQANFFLASSKFVASSLFCDPENPPQQIGLDLSEGNTLYAKVGNSYDIRLTNAKEHDEVQCKFNKEAVPGNVLALNHKEKKGKHYQLRIRHFSEENVGSYECTLRLGEKHELFMKEFVATLEAEPATSSSCSLLIKSVLLIAFIVIQQCN